MHRSDDHGSVAYTGQFVGSFGLLDIRARLSGLIREIRLRTDRLARVEWRESASIGPILIRHLRYVECSRDKFYPKLFGGDFPKFIKQLSQSGTRSLHSILHELTGRNP